MCYGAGGGGDFSVQVKMSIDASTGLAASFKGCILLSLERDQQ